MNVQFALRIRAAFALTPSHPAPPPHGPPPLQVLRTLNNGKQHYSGVLHPEEDKQNVLMTGCQVRLLRHGCIIQSSYRHHNHHSMHIASLPPSPTCITLYLGTASSPCILSPAMLLGGFPRLVLPLTLPRSLPTPPSSPTSPPSCPPPSSFLNLLPSLATPLSLSLTLPPSPPQPPPPLPPRSSQDKKIYQWDLDTGDVMQVRGDTA